MPDADASARRKTPSAALIAEAARLVAERDAAWAAGEPVELGPWMDPCVCGAGRHAHGGAANRGSVPGTRCRKFRPTRGGVERLIADAFGARDNGFAQDLRDYERLTRVPSPRPVGSWSVRVSDLGACARAVGYRNLAQLAEIHGGELAEQAEAFVAAPTDMRAARMGSFIHDGWQARQRVLYPWRIFEEPLPVAGLDGRYRFDDFDPITGRLRSTKTAGAWRWDAVKVDGAADAWIDAECLYAVAIEAEMGWTVRDIMITVIERADGADVSFVLPWDDSMRERAETARARLTGIMSLFDLGIMPERERSGPSTDPICKGCFARRTCWQMDTAERVRRSPESVVILGLEPEARDIEWAIEQVVAATRAATEADKLKEQAQVLIDGIPLGTFGTGEIRPGRRATVSWKGTTEAILAVFDKADGDRPKAAQIRADIAAAGTASGTAIQVPLSRPSRPTAALLSAAKRAAIARAAENIPRPTPEDDVPLTQEVEAAAR